MSARTECSALTHLEEVDSLENVDKEIQLVSTTTEPNSISQYSIENEPIDDVKFVPELKGIHSVKSFKQDHTKDKKKVKNNQKIFNNKFYSSLDDLCTRADEKLCSGKQALETKKGSTLVNLKHNKSVGNKKHKNIQSKMKHKEDAKYEIMEKKLKSSTNSGVKDEKKKDEYLEEINKQLMKELEEKNAILLVLQENYERLLFKYAEAQNRIDELRFKCMVPNPDNKRSNHQIISNNNIVNSVPSRSLSLPLDNNNTKLTDKGVILTKATTPTDSEGLSSIITSMSGHSKILNSLDEENEGNRKSFKSSTANFLLDGSASVNDPFDKVKNWQNSLPPLEQIETPETALHNGFPNNSGYFSSEETKYNEIKSPEKDNDYDFLNESCPTDWMEENVSLRRSKSSNSSKMSSLPGTLNKKKGVNSLHGKENYRLNNAKNGKNDMPKENRISSEGSQKSKNSTYSDRKDRKSSKQPHLLRCLSLPSYDQKSVRSGIRKNGIYIPSLDLRNVALSDEESYCQQNYYVSKNNVSSGTTSRESSNDRYFQTSKSSSSWKNTMSEDNFSPRVLVQTADKNTSITPDRNKPLDSFLGSNKINNTKEGIARREKEQNFQPPTDRTKIKTLNHCNICGVFLPENSNNQSIRNRSNSCDSMHGNNTLDKSSIPAKSRSKPPFKRSVSFGSEAMSSKYCSHEFRMAENFYLIPSQESLDNFETYTNSLKKRSQLVMKALTAHINNS